MKKNIVFALVLIVIFAVGITVGILWKAPEQPAPQQTEVKPVAKPKPDRKVVSANPAPTKAKDPYKSKEVIRHKVMLKNLKRFKVRPKVQTTVVVGQKSETANESND